MNMLCPVTQKKKTKENLVVFVISVKVVTTVLLTLIHSNENEGDNGSTDEDIVVLFFSQYVLYVDNKYSLTDENFVLSTNHKTPMRAWFNIVKTSSNLTFGSDSFKRELYRGFIGLVGFSTTRSDNP